MTKFNELAIYKQAIRVYIMSLLISLLSSPLFDKLYIWILKPTMFGGDLYFPVPDLVGIIMNGTLFAFYLFLPFFVFWLIRRKQWLIWFVGAILPLLIALVGGKKNFLWALIFSVIGWLLAQGMLLIKKKNK